MSSNVRTIEQIARQLQAGAQVMVVGGPMSLWSQRLQRDRMIIFHSTLGRREDGIRAITIPPKIEVVLPCIKIAIQQLAHVRHECDARGVVRPCEALSPSIIRTLLANLPSQRCLGQPEQNDDETEETIVAQPVKVIPNNLHQVLDGKGVGTPPKLRTYTGTLEQWVRDQLNGHAVQPSIGELYRGAVSVGFVTTQDDVSRAVVNLIGQSVTGRRAESELDGLDSEVVAAIKQIDDAIVGLELVRSQMIAFAHRSKTDAVANAKELEWAKNVRELLTIGPKT